jgi:hypothetical protein
MSWKAQPAVCENCHERKGLHDRKGRCRFEQPGWIDVITQIPTFGNLVMARRGKEVFVALLKAIFIIGLALDFLFSLED